MEKDSRDKMREEILDEERLMPKTEEYPNLTQQWRDGKILEARIKHYAELIDNEIYRQRKKFGVQNRNHLEWFAILGEEVGEVAEEVVHNCIHPETEATPIENLREEIIQVAAVCLSWLGNMDRGIKE